MDNLLQIAANFAQIIGTAWAIVLGGQTLAKLIKTMRQKQAFRIPLSAINTFFTVLILITVVIILFRVAGNSYIGVQGRDDRTSQTSPASPPTLTPISTPTPTLTPMPSPQPNTILCQTKDWSNGLNGWKGGSSSWKVVSGMLVNDGSESGDSTITPPCQITTADYAVEATIQLAQGGTNSSAGFGMVARGYKGWINTYYGDFAAIDYATHSPITYSSDTLASKDNYQISISSTHTYRLEVKNDTITFLIDGNVVVNTIDNKYLSGGQPALCVNGSQINIQNFEVIAL